MVVRCTGVLLVIGIFLIVFPPEVFMGRYNTLWMDVTDKIARSILDSVTEKDISGKHRKFIMFMHLQYRQRR